MHADFHRAMQLAFGNPYPQDFHRIFVADCGFGYEALVKSLFFVFHFFVVDLA